MKQNSEQEQLDNNKNEKKSKQHSFTMTILLKVEKILRYIDLVGSNTQINNKYKMF